MTPRTKKREISDRTKAICRQVVLRDAKTWYKRDYPRVYRRPKTIKHTDATVRNEIDRFFREMNESIDDFMKGTYARLYEKYDGDVRDLPWFADGGDGLS